MVQQTFERYSAFLDSLHLIPLVKFQFWQHTEQYHINGYRLFMCENLKETLIHNAQGYSAGYTHIQELVRELVTFLYRKSVYEQDISRKHMQNFNVHVCLLFLS